jgi:glycosyltransferase involved in cell wall biosynthesis
MRKLLFLLSSLDYHGDARQATLLAKSLPREHFHVEVVSMAGDGPLGTALKEAGVPLHGARGARFFNLEDWLGLRRLLATLKPDAVHVWDLSVLRDVRIAALGRWAKVPPVVLHSAAPGRHFGWIGRRLLRRAARIVAVNEAERAGLIAVGIGPDRIAIIHPIVAPAPPPADPRQTRRQLGLPEGARVIMSVGRMESVEPFRTCVWAFDILRYLYRDLYLVLVGDGPGRSALEGFSRAVMGNDHRVIYAGARPDAASLFHLAEVAWIPNRKPGGTNATLEAMAAGKPVVASALPNLVVLVEDGTTGFVVNPHDPPAFSRITRRLLEEPALGRALGAAGRRRAQTEFAADRIVKRFADLQDELVNHC